MTKRRLLILLAALLGVWAVSFLGHAFEQWDIATDDEQKIVELQGAPSAAADRQALIENDRRARASEWDVFWFCRS